MSIAGAFRGFAARVVWIKMLTVAAWILIWESFARSGLFYEGVVPPVVTVLRALVQELLEPGFYHDLAVTLLESIVGFIVGSVVAVAFGIGLGLRPFIRRMIEPFVTALGGTPKIIFLPILFLIFGLGIESKMAKAALSAFFPVVLSTTSGFIEIRAHTPERRPKFSSEPMADARQDLCAGNDQSVVDRPSARHGNGDHRRALGRDQLFGQRARVPPYSKCRSIQHRIRLRHHHFDIRHCRHHESRNYKGSRQVQSTPKVELGA
jgi:hypothetical protein